MEVLPIDVGMSRGTPPLRQVWLAVKPYVRNVSDSPRKSRQNILCQWFALLP